MDEVQTFLEATVIKDRISDPLNWLKSNESRFPQISKLAWDVINVQETSVESKRAFSSASQMIGGKRSKLSDESIIITLLLLGLKVTFFRLQTSYIYGYKRVTKNLL